MVNTSKLYALITSILRAPNFHGTQAAVAISSGNYAFNLDLATVFDATVSADGTVSFTAKDPTKCYQAQINATTSGAYNFTSFSMSGVTIYRRNSGAVTLKSSGRTCLGIAYDGPSATLDIFDVQMAPA